MAKQKGTCKGCEKEFDDALDHAEKTAHTEFTDKNGNSFSVTPENQHGEKGLKDS